MKTPFEIIKEKFSLAKEITVDDDAATLRKVYISDIINVMQAYHEQLSKPISDKLFLQKAKDYAQELIDAKTIEEYQRSWIEAVYCHVARETLKSPSFHQESRDKEMIEFAEWIATHEDELNYNKDERIWQGIHGGEDWTNEYDTTTAELLTIFRNTTKA